MNAVFELINSRRKLVRDVAFLTTEGRMFQRNGLHHCSLSYFYSTWQGNSKLILKITHIVRSNHITPLNEFRGQITGC